MDLFVFQAAEFMYVNDDVTIGFDATTRAGQHINAINVHNGNAEFVISVEEVPGM